MLKIGLIGDSTVAEESGWGPAFARRFGDAVEVLNYAKNGATLETLTDRFNELLTQAPDYVLIQFGHNDQKCYGTDEYRARLSDYVDRVRAAGGKPIIVSSVTRRTFGGHGEIVNTLTKTEAFEFVAILTEYARTAQSVARAQGVPCIDLHTMSVVHHNEIGEAESMTYNYKEGDTTHFNRKGGEAITNLVLRELKGAAPELATHMVAREATAESLACSDGPL